MKQGGQRIGGGLCSEPDTMLGPGQRPRLKGLGLEGSQSSPWEADWAGSRDRWPMGNGAGGVRDAWGPGPQPQARSGAQG